VRTGECACPHSSLTHLCHLQLHMLPSIRPLTQKPTHLTDPPGMRLAPPHVSQHPAHQRCICPSDTSCCPPHILPVHHASAICHPPTHFAHHRCIHTSHPPPMCPILSHINLAWNNVQLPTLHLSPYLNTNSLFVHDFHLSSNDHHMNSFST